MTPSRSGLALFALALVAAGLALASARRRAAEPPGVVERMDAAGVESPAVLREPPRHAPDERRPLPRPAPPQHAAAPELVRVHGRVLRAGLGVESCGVSFRPARDPAGGDVDWDLTDGAGRFSVRLEPGRYVVATEDDADRAWTEEVLVAAGPAELELDLRLP